MMRAGWLGTSALLLWMGCRDSGSLAGGSGSQTTNTVTGAFVNGSGQLQSGIRVRLVPAGFDPVSDSSLPPSLADTTDASGRYRIHGVPDGEYALEADHGVEGGCFAALKLRLAGARETIRPPDTLRSPGSITVRLSAAARAHGGYLYVPGTDYCVRMAPSDSAPGEVRLEPLPPGIYPRLLYTREATAAREVVDGAPFLVLSGGVTPAGAFAKWASARRITLHGGSDGAGLRQGVRDFPLLVRLDSARFDFSQARGDGADVRVADDAGAPLPMEIERWDSAGRRAELWVRLDSVPAGATVRLWLFAGNPTAPKPIQPAAVFDTAAGFSGVWHLQTIGHGGAADTAASAMDATQFGTRAYARNGAGTSIEEGPAGAAMEFDGVDDFLDLGAGPAMDPGAAMTLEAWIKPSRLPHQGTGFDDALIIARFDAYSLELQADGTSEGWVRTGPAKDAGTLRSPAAVAAAGAWIHLAATYDGAMLKTYADGTLTAELAATGPVSSSALHTLIGYIEGWPGTDRYFAGAIDEARISRTARAPEWLRLGYETQKPGNANVTVDKPAE